MTQQALPPTEAQQLADARTATANAQALALQWQAVADKQRKQLELLTEALNRADFIIASVRAGLTFSAELTTLFTQELVGYDSAMACVSSNKAEAQCACPRRAGVEG